MKRKKFVFDTNSFISAALLKDSVNSKALDYAFKAGIVIVSSNTFAEFTEVIFKKNLINT